MVGGYFGRESDKEYSHCLNKKVDEWNDHSFGKLESRYSFKMRYDNSIEMFIPVFLMNLKLE